MTLRLACINRQVRLSVQNGSPCRYPTEPFITLTPWDRCPGEPLSVQNVPFASKELLKMLFA